jgi:hypothetical protein
VLESVHSNDVEDHAVVIDQEGRSQRRHPSAADRDFRAVIPSGPPAGDLRGQGRSDVPLSDAMPEFTVAVF